MSAEQVTMRSFIDTNVLVYASAFTLRPIPCLGRLIWGEWLEWS